MKHSRAAGFTVITVIYIVAVGFGAALFMLLPELHIFWRVLIADAGATVFVYLTGVLLGNASVYDPYWSVAPIVILTGTALHFQTITNAGVLLMLSAIWFWGLRLTCNWAYTFKNLNTQDWRYDNFKRRFPRSFQLISFFGINMFPTVIVYLCLLPGIVFIRESAFNAVTALGAAVCVAAAALQMAADIQLHRFRRENAGKLIRSGLWKHSRHPNYLGEILMWWGVYIIMLSAAPRLWFLLAGAFANTLMFFFVSIPLADNHNREKREGFEAYLRETNSLLPFRVKK